MLGRLRRLDLWELERVIGRVMPLHGSGLIFYAGSLWYSLSPSRELLTLWCFAIIELAGVIVVHLCVVSALLRFASHAFLS